MQCFFFFFSGPLGRKFPPLSFEFPPQTITNFVCLFFTFLSQQKQFTPKTTSLENTLHACSVEFIVGVNALASYYSMKG